MPLFRDWAEPPTADHAARSDARALATVNAVLAESNVRPLAALFELFYPERTVLCTWPELDHYAGVGRSVADYRGPDCAFAPGAAPQWPHDRGPRVFAYLRGAHPEHADVLRALDTLGCATECFIPDAPAQGDALPRSANIHYSQGPVDMERVVAECSLVVCHAGQATVAQALRAGIPLLLLPLQAEQFLLARQVERAGAGINAASLARPVDYVSIIDAVGRPDGASAVVARTVASRYQAFDPAGLAQEIARAAGQLLA